MNKFILPCFLLFLLVNSCAKDTKSDVEVYTNDFESGDLSAFSGGTISTYNSTKVLGRYNNGGFYLTLHDLPAHDMVEVSFDLYIHDSWDGNSRDNDYSGPDIWQLKISDKLYINTTFSNNACPANTFCAPQSYPDNYQNSNHVPRSGAAKKGLPNACGSLTDPKGTTLYKITKRIGHTDKQLLVQCLDHLIQKNFYDPLCDESWSVDNIKVRIINLN